MSTLAIEALYYTHPVRRFLRTPKGIVLAMLVVAVGLAILAERSTTVIPGVLAAVVVAAGLDLAFVAIRRRKWVFPSGAILSGLFVALVLSPHEPLTVAVVASILAVGSKRLLRLNRSNVFNPAAFGLVATAILFGSGHSWWGSLPGLGLAGLLVVTAGGAFVADRINKLPVVLTFLGGYFLLFSLSAIAGDAARFADVFRAPDLHAALFFGLFMLDDPPTCPVRYRDQVQFGLVVAAATFAVFVLLGAVYFLPAGLLVGNLHEAGRKQLSSRRRRRARSVSLVAGTATSSGGQ